MSVERPNRSAGSWSASLKWPGLSMRHCLTILANFIFASGAWTAVSLSPSVLKERRNETRHPRVKIGRGTHDADVGELRPLLTRSVAHNAGTKLFRVLPRRHAFEQRQIAAIAYQAPARL